MVDKITTDDRIKDIQICLQHMKKSLDVVTYYFQQIDKKGIKIQVKK